MQADREDRFDDGAAPSRHGTQTLITAIAVIILAGAAYLFAPGDDDAAPQDTASSAPLDGATPTLNPPPQPQPRPEIIAAPDIPVQSPPPETTDEQVADGQEATAPAPPTPEELDELMRDGVSDSGLELPSALKTAYAAPYLLDRGISSLDQIARGLMPARTLNLSRPKGDFAIIREGQQRLVDPAGYARYDRLVGAVSALPAERVAQLFHRFRPQITDAYAALGYPAEAMDNTVIAALDQIINAPVRREPLELREKGALYAFVDEALEGASGLHKQLLRTGPDNTEKLQTWAREMRAELLRKE